MAIKRKRKLNVTPLIQPLVRAMIENEGMYLCGDTNNPELTVPIVSIRRKLFSIKIDSELAPELFFASLTANGPFHKDN